ncbi:MAG TPA: hypothetical protein VF981_04700 [Gemmatimonadaceae bacterium]
MTRVLFMAALAVTTAWIAPAAAGAQDTVSRAGTVVRMPSYESLLSAITATSTAAEKIKARVALTTAEVRVVSVSEFVDDAREEAFDEAIDRQKDNLPVLREAISKAAPIRDALAAHANKPTANDVVAVDIAEAGDVIVYIKS